jgi:heme/copper-type cytochrome/quinol oxidase subunit 2
MRGWVKVDEESDYKEWLSEQMTFEDMMVSIGKNDLIQLALNNKGDN